MPRPFAHDPDAVNPLLDLPDSAGVLVTPVDGVAAPEARRFARLMAEALLRRNIPASTVNSNRRSYRLRGRLENSAGAGAVLVWDLFDRAGKRLGSQTQAIAAAERAIPSRHFADGAAARIGALIQREAARPAPPPPASAVKVFVPPVAGAPGDGARSLQNAMRIALTRAGLRVVDAADDAAFSVVGRVALGRAAGPRRPIAIAWSVRRGGGGTVGTIRQQNLVSSALIQGAWGDMAHAVALGAADGVRDLLRRAAAGKPAAR